MISALLATIVPTFGIIAIGWVARRVRVWDGSSVVVLNNYAYYIALPALIFQSIITADLGETFTRTDALLIAGVLGAHLIVGAVIWLLTHGQSRVVHALFPLLTTLGSTAYLGIPYATFTFGKEGTVYASLISVALVIVLLFVNLPFLNRAGQSRLHHSVIVTMLELPFLWAVALAILWPILHLPALPLFLSRLLDIVAQSAGPTALLGLGTFLYDLKPRDIPWRSATLAAALKVTLPALATFFLLHALGVTGVRLAVGVAMGAVATGVTCFVLAEQYKIGGRLTAGTILLSTLFSLAALSFVSYAWIGTTIFQ